MPTVELIQAAPRSDHRFLDGVVCIKGRAQHAIAMARENGAMSFEVGVIHALVIG